MVYRGKPSKGCQRCRLRRIKCDQSVPGCSSCARADVPCSGYRPIEQIRLCDQTAAVNASQQQRRKTFYTHAASQAAVPSFKATKFDQAPYTSLRSDRAIILSAPLPSADDVAFCVCRTEYICPSDNWLAACDNDSAALIQACMKTLGVFTCAAIHQTPNASCVALEYYSQALSHLNAALATPARVEDDRTLLAVMILTHVQTTSLDQEQQFPGWTAHIRGCVHLLSLRGESRLRMEENQHLFFQAALNIISHCFQSATRTPVSLEDLAASIQPHLRPGSTTYTIWNILMARILMANIFSDFVHDRIPNVREAVDKVLVIDQRLSDLLGSAPQVAFNPSEMPSWQSFIEYFLLTAGQAAILNVRLLFHLLILALSRELEQTDLCLSGQIDRSRRIVDNLRKQILDIAIHQSELVEHENHYRSTGPSSSSQLLLAQIGVANAAFFKADESLVRTLAGTEFNVLEAPQTPALRLSRGNNIAWALFLVGGLGKADSPERRQASDCLRRIGNAFGIMQAATLADRLNVKS